MSIKGGASHYKAGTIEPLELIESQKLSFHMGNAVKYAVRAEFYKDKDDNKFAEAINKAIWYLNRYKEING